MIRGLPQTRPDDRHAKLDDRATAAAAKGVADQMRFGDSGYVQGTGYDDCLDSIFQD
jgi:hypothetical protein